MIDLLLPSESPEICLMLRSHAEQMWLTSEVLPTVRQLEREESVPEEQTGAALAYLEMLWLDACVRAADTEAAYEGLMREDTPRDRLLCEKARRYHTAVRRMRASAHNRVNALMGLPGAPIRRRISGGHASR